MTKRPVIILGAGSFIASHLARVLVDQGYAGVRASRHRPPPAPPDVEQAFPWQALDLQDPGSWQAPPQATVISLVVLSLLIPALGCLTQSGHIIAFGSTSRYTRRESRDPEDVRFAAALEQAEEALAGFAAQQGIPWTLLRPTLVYDPGHDKNVSAIAAKIRRFGFFPVANPGSGLRQPVHAQDLAQAAAAAIGNQEACNMAFNLSGGETLSYRQMVERIFNGLDRPCRILPLPQALLAFLFRFLPGKGGDYSPTLVARMNQDMVFDHTPAQRILGFTPRSFHPRFPPHPAESPTRT